MIATRILGIDPGSRVTGYGIIEHRNGRLAYVGSGCIRTQREDLSERLRVIFEGISEIVTEFTPDEVAIENVFMQRNAASALKLGQARGAAICAVVMRSLAVAEYTPTQIKQALVGRGAADKAQVQHMVKALLGLSAAPQADAADALACALCHGHVSQTLQRVAGNRGAVSEGRWR